MFKIVRPILRMALSLERIATSLEYFATADARKNNVMFVPKTRGWLAGADKSELMHTDNEYIARLRDEEHELLRQRGYPAVEAEELQDE